MNYRESSILRRPGRRSRRRRSGLRIFLFILLGVLVFTALGFGISLILRGGASKQTDPSQNPSGNPLPCATKMITPAEVLPFSNEVKVTVLNGTNRIGLAGDTTKVLIDVIHTYIEGMYLNNPLHLCMSPLIACPENYFPSLLYFVFFCSIIRLIKKTTLWCICPYWKYMNHLSKKQN